MQYTIVITSPEGCTVIDTLKVLVPAAAPIPPPEAYVPTGWTPNGDGHNDNLVPFLVNVKQLNYFRIYNRWGQLVFETKEMGKGWDGRYNGQLQVIDQYTWNLEVVGINGAILRKTGNSTLIR